MIVWIRPSGTELKTNDSPAIVKFCESKGFTRKGDNSKPKDIEMTKIVVPQKYNEHQSVIEAMNDKSEIESYVKKVCGVDIDKRGGLDTIKAKGLAAIEAWENGNS